MELKVGMITPMKSCTIIHGDKSTGEIMMSYRKPKGQRYVFMILGVENDDGTDPLDCAAVLGQMGWKLK